MRQDKHFCASTQLIVSKTDQRREDRHAAKDAADTQLLQNINALTLLGCPLVDRRHNYHFVEENVIQCDCLVGIFLPWATVIDYIYIYSYCIYHCV